MNRLFICPVCSYHFEGDFMPEKCPICGKPMQEAKENNRHIDDCNFLFRVNNGRHLHQNPYTIVSGKIVKGKISVKETVTYMGNQTMEHVEVAGIEGKWNPNDTHFEGEYVKLLLSPPIPYDINPGDYVGKNDSKRNDINNTPLVNQKDIGKIQTEGLNQHTISDNVVPNTTTKYLSMEQIITKARNEYPHNQTQQFYRIIKPVIDDICANSKDEDWQSESFVEETNEINVVRQFFLYKGHRYCFWICLFPYLTPDGKKNAYYGIDMQKDGKWKALWSEVEDNIQFWFKLRIAVRLIDEDNELLAELNPFENAIKNAPYSSDIFEERKIITEIITEYSKVGYEDLRQKELNTGNKRMKFDLFKMFGNWYLWTDLYENGLLEAFRLDVIYNQNTSLVLFSNIANDEQLYAPAIFKLFMN